MRRILLIALIIFGVGMVMAQDEPTTTEEPSVEVIPAEGTTQEEAPVSSQPESLFGDSLSELINLRNDLELLATAVQGTNRPDGWSGNLDVTNPQLPLLIRTDMELLLADMLGFDTPDGWFGISLGATQYQVRDMRHDLELLADALLGDGSRPNGWGGNPNPIWACERSVQTLYKLMAQGDFFVAQADPASPDYCAILELQLTNFIEQNLFTIDTTESFFTSGVKTSLPGGILVNTDFAVGFFDIIASQRASVIPNGTAVSPLGRSTVQFSRMVLVEGDGFLLYVEYPFTSITEDEFKDLGAAPAVQTFCNADWC